MSVIWSGVTEQGAVVPIQVTVDGKVVAVSSIPSDEYLKLTGGNLTGDLTVNQQITLATDGSIDASADATINTLTVGLGGGSVSSNTAVGRSALFTNTTGIYNTAVGNNALLKNTIGNLNTALGYGAINSNTTGVENTGLGYGTLSLNTEGNHNTAVGTDALRVNTEGGNNVAVGRQALLSNLTGATNTAVGVGSLYSNTGGNFNSSLGFNSLYRNTTGANNTALGVNALAYNNTGSGNIAIGGMNSAGTYAPVFNPTTEDNRIVMGSTSVTNAYVQVAWTVTSDARDKTNFAPVPYGLDFVKQLQPTAYQFKAGSRNARDPETNELIPVTAADELPSGPVRYGFKAQDILALEGDNPVIIDNEDLDHLRYRGESLIPVLVNAIQEQQVLIDALTKRVDSKTV